MFLYLRIELFAGDYQPRRSESGGPTDATKLAEAKLALENEAQRTLEPAALQLTTFLTSFFRAAEISQGERVWLRQKILEPANEEGIQFDWSSRLSFLGVAAQNKNTIVNSDSRFH